jgi:CRISPR-associated DxTHG motif protein
MSDKLKLLTFVGLNDYEKVRYAYNGETLETELFAEALSHWHAPTKIIAFLTPKAKESGNWKKLQERIPGIVGVDIPNGNSEAELWRIFSKMTESLDERDEVIFDITHAFRSIPMLALLATSFLRTAKNVELKTILYGAYEAKDEEGHVPVFNLTPFVSLLDWITATNQFIRNGEGNELAGLLKAYPDAGVQQLTESIEKISDGLRLLRPLDVMKRAVELPQLFADANAVISQKIPPFGLLAQNVEQSYSIFGVSNPDPQRGAKDILARQLRIVEWYLGKGQIVQCLSLAREWIPSLLCLHFNADPKDRHEREDMELLLVGGRKKDRAGNIVAESLRLSQWSTVPEGKRLQLLWSNQPFNLASIRNDVLHSGFTKNPKGTDEIKAQTEEIVTELKEIAALWNLYE